MRAFLEKMGNEWLDDFVYMSKFKFMDLGVDVIAFDGDDLNTLFKHRPSKNDVLIGSVEVTTKFFEYLEVDVPSYLGYPEELKSYLLRDIKTCKYSELSDSYPYFVKPKDGVKLFTGSLVANSTQRSYLEEYSDIDFLVSDPIDFVSEWRCFVHKGELKGIQYYLGDYCNYPNTDKIKEMISKYKESPVSYTLDVGVVKSGETALVEVNDMWAIGSYGFDAKTYVRMSIDRFMEIYKNTYK